MSNQKKYQVMANVTPKPTAYELSAARLVCDFLKKDVRFVQVGRLKSADLLIDNQMWEIKAPLGSKTQTVMHQFQRASKQAQCLIFDARRIKMSPKRCLSRVEYYFRQYKTIKRLIFIDDKGGVRELKR